MILRDCGLTEGEVLSALTFANAKLLGLEASLGLVEQGYVADLVVVRGDPLKDLQVVRDIEYVVVAGKMDRPTDINLWIGDETSDWNSLQIVEAE